MQIIKCINYLLKEIFFLQCNWIVLTKTGDAKFGYAYFLQSSEGDPHSASYSNTSAFLLNIIHLPDDE